MARQLRAYAVTVLVLAALGVAAGPLWSWVAPRAPYQVTPQGTALADPTTQALIGADGWFAVITGGLGAVCGLAAWFLCRRRTPIAAVLGLATGGALAAALTLWIGSTFTFGAVSVQASATPGVQIVAGTLQLTAPGVLVAWPFLAVAMFAVLEGVSGYRDSPLRQPYGVRPEEWDGGSRTL